MLAERVSLVRPHATHADHARRRRRDAKRPTGVSQGKRHEGRGLANGPLAEALRQVHLRPIARAPGRPKPRRCAGPPWTCSKAMGAAWNGPERGLIGGWFGDFKAPDREAAGHGTAKRSRGSRSLATERIVEEAEEGGRRAPRGRYNANGHLSALNGLFRYAQRTRPIRRRQPRHRVSGFPPAPRRAARRAARLDPEAA